MYGRRAIWTIILAGFAAAAIMSGCSFFRGDRIEAVGLTSPSVNNVPVYEDGSLRVAFSVVDDRLIDMAVTNKTGKSMRIFWANSTFAAVDDPDAKLDYLDGGKPASAKPDKSGISVITPGGAGDFKVFPAYSVTDDPEGGFGNTPLYVNRDGKGGIDNLYGKMIGVNLVMEINGGTRMYKFRLDLTPHKSDDS